MKNITLVSLGCAKNLVDSENILGLLDYDRFNITNDTDEADLILINTCGFIEASQRESIVTILKYVNQGKKVIVTGCLVERFYNELKKSIPEVTLFIPIRDYPRFNERLLDICDDLPDREGLRDELRILSTPQYSAYLKIGEGCSNHCTYCAIPIIRGEYASRPFDDIIKEAKVLASKGVKEIIVLEQDTTKYGSDLKEKKTIVDLLKALLEIKEFDYIRLLYLYPDEISDELIDLIGQEKRLTPYFDIPIQHSEDHVLFDMNRRGDKKFLFDLFKKIRDKVPHAVLRTTLMVGFPGETEEDVDNLIEFIKVIRFDHLGVFTYSKEEGTRSYDFPNQVDEKTKNERLERIMKVQKSISYNNNKLHVGEIMEGMIVGQDGPYYLFRSYWNAPDDVDGKILIKTNRNFENGEKVTVRITNAFVYDLLGEVVED